MAPIIEARSPTLSTIENLPTETVQHIASYLIRADDNEDYSFWGRYRRPRYASDGVVELRSTSRALRAKTEHIFKRCLTVKVVAFHRYTLKLLVQLSQSTTYSPLVQDLVFVASRSDEDRMLLELEDKGLGLGGDVVMEDSAVKELKTHHVLEMSLTIVAMKGFKNLKMIDIGRSLQRCYPANVRQRSLAQHPPSILLVATILSGLALEHLHMIERSTGSFHGIKPRVLDNFARDMGCFANLKTITLVLTSRNFGTGSAVGLQKLLSSATKLKVLNFVMDKASIDETAPLTASRTVDIWDQVSMLNFARLQALNLRGVEMREAAIVQFLSIHQDTLVQLKLENCILLGDWCIALGTLLDSKSLRSLWLGQLGQDFFRVEFPKTCITWARAVLDEEDWQWVGRRRHLAFIEPGGHWRSKLTAIIEDLGVISVEVHPHDWDALIWRSHLE